MSRPAEDQIITVNDDLNVVYSLWLAGTRYRRQPGWWDYMPRRDYVAPTTNPTLLRLVSKGLVLGLAEHVSFTVSGRVRYTYDTPEGFADDVGVAGEHNVENGGGYLSIHAFTREIEQDHVSCCIVPKPGVARTHSYRFEIADAPDGAATFSHQIVGFPSKFIVGKLNGG